MTHRRDVVVIGPAFLAEAVAAQGIPVEWRPPPRADMGDALLGALTMAYADERIDVANGRVVRHIASARPHLVAVAPAGTLLEVGGATRWVMVGGPPRGWEELPPHQRAAACGTCVLEGWAGDVGDARMLLEDRTVTLLSTDGSVAAVPGAAAIGPSTPCWVVRDGSTGARGVAPVLHSGRHGLWRGDAGDESLRRARVMAETVAPGLAAALRAAGPVDVMDVVERALRMGDDGHGRTEALTLCTLAALLPHLALRAPQAIHPLATLAGDDGALGLGVALAAARSVHVGVPEGPSSIVTCVTGDGVGGASIMVAGLPGRWFTARTETPGDGAGRARAHLGDSGLVELMGLGAATGTPVPGMADGGAETPAQALERAAQRRRVCVAPAARPTGAAAGALWVGVDIRSCCELGVAPVLALPALGRSDGDPVPTRPLAVPQAACVDALHALLYRLEDAG